MHKWVDFSSIEELIEKRTLEPLLVYCQRTEFISWTPRQMEELRFSSHGGIKTPLEQFTLDIFFSTLQPQEVLMLLLDLVEILNLSFSEAQ